MQILIAPNAFKNSLSATDAAGAIKEGIEQSGLSCRLHCFPIGDGGDGTAQLLVNFCKGEMIAAKVRDPLGRMITSRFGWIDEDQTAIIEMADASGLRLLDKRELDPLHTSSFGTGELMGHALEKGAHKIILCIGGSATVDGGTGILKALGFRFLRKDGKELKNVPEDLTELETIDRSKVEYRVYKSKIVVLCDVENPLLGPHGAAKVFGPQKGATPGDVKKLEACLIRWRDVALAHTKLDMDTLKHGGAAGGVAAGLAAMLHADLVNGIEYFLSFTDFEKALKEADLVITAEGSIDQQTLNGKGPFGVAKKAHEHGKPVVGLAGAIPLDATRELDSYFDVQLSINNKPDELSVALLNTKRNLVRTAKNLGNLLQIGSRQKRPGK